MLRFIGAPSGSPRSIETGSVQAYLFAVLAVATAFAIRWGLGLLIDNVAALAVYYIAVFATAFFAGIRAGVLSIALSVLAGLWTLMPAEFSFDALRPGQIANLVTFVIGSSLIVWGIDHHRTIAQQLEAQESLRAVAVEELSHRLKNKLATFQAILSYQLRDQPLLHRAVTERFSALAATDDLIRAANGAGAHLDQILQIELGPYDLSRTAIAGPNVFLPSQLALLVTLLVHELATNAAKYGCLSDARGHLMIDWTLTGDRLDLVWEESGGPAVVPPTRTGFGTRMITRSLVSFGGGVDLSFNESGLTAKLTLKLPEAPQPKLASAHATPPR